MYKGLQRLSYPVLQSWNPSGQPLPFGGLAKIALKFAFLVVALRLRSAGTWKVGCRAVGHVRIMDTLVRKHPYFEG